MSLAIDAQCFKALFCDIFLLLDSRKQNNAICHMHTVCMCEIISNFFFISSLSFPLRAASCGGISFLFDVETMLQTFVGAVQIPREMDYTGTEEERMSASGGNLLKK